MKNLLIITILALVSTTLLTSCECQYQARMFKDNSDCMQGFATTEKQGQAYADGVKAALEVNRIGKQ